MLRTVTFSWLLCECVVHHVQVFVVEYCDAVFVRVFDGMYIV